MFCNTKYNPQMHTHTSDTTTHTPKHERLLKTELWTVNHNKCLEMENLVILKSDLEIFIAEVRILS